MKKILLLLFTVFTLFAQAQDGDSFLCVDDFKLLGPDHTFILPDGMRKTDNNGKQWAMVKIVAKGFDSKILNDISFYSPSSTLTVGNASMDAEDGSYKIIMSSGVNGKLIFKYQGTTLEYQLPVQLVKKRVYQLDLAIRSANLTIVATPADAKIYIDGEEVGADGYASVNLRLGEHTYSVECKNHLNEKNKSIRLEKNERLDVNLKPLFGYISINSKPSGADVYIDGAHVGRTPYINKKINRGKNNVVLKLNGYHDYPELVDVGMGEQKTMDVQMVRYGDLTYNVKNAITTELTLYLSRDTLYFDSSQSRDSVLVTTNNIEWNFKDAPRWVSLYRRSNVLYITCLENRMHASREADVTIFTGDISTTLHIVQEEGKTVLKTNDNRMVFEAAGDSIIRRIETNVWNWDIRADRDWIHAYEKGDTLVVLCEENTMPVSRHGNITVRAFDQERNFNVYQKSCVTKIMIPKEDNVIEKEGGTMAISVGQVKGAWTCSTDETWMKVSRSGDVVILDCEKNLSKSRRGSFIVNTNTKTYRYFVVQKGEEEDSKEVIVDSKPSWSRLYIDDEYVGRTPVRRAIDDSVHLVRLGRETRSYVFNMMNEGVTFNTGLRYIQITMSSKTVGLRSGFIGTKHWGGYNHFQLNMNNWDTKPSGDKGPLYIVSAGPSFEILPWLSVYAGAGVGFSNDTLRIVPPGEKPNHKHAISELSEGYELEAGLMFYYRDVFASAGVQYNHIGMHQNFDYSFGLGLYLNRYYDSKYGYCSTRSRQWWSLNYMYNPGRNGHGIMFNDVGKNSVRWYIKAMGEFNKVENVDEIAPLVTTGVTFNLMPGYIDFMVGGGYQAAIISKSLVDKGLQAEVGFVMNIWRIPLTIMMRCSEINKSTRYLTVDFGVGFSFGEFSHSKKH